MSEASRVHSNKRFATIVFSMHVAWTFVVLLGIPLALAFQWYKPIHLTVVIMTAAANLFWLGCPLTEWEIKLREKYDPERSYTGSFIAHYLQKHFSITISPLIIRLQVIIILLISLKIAL